MHTGNRHARWAIWCAVVAVLAALAACGSTRLMASWKDPAFTGPPMKRLLVIGAVKSDLNRRVFEDAFAGALNGVAGNSGVVSYPMLPESGAMSNERVRQGVQSSGADGVLVTRLMRVRQDVYVAPSHLPTYYGAGFGGWYGRAYAMTPADVSVYDVLTIESTLWNMSSDKAVWSGTSEITAPSDIAAASKELADVLIAKMKADGVI